MEPDTLSRIRKKKRLIKLLPVIVPLLRGSLLIRCNVGKIVAVQNNYVGLWIRIQHRFGPRFSEWMMSMHMLAAALVLFTVEDLFTRESYVKFLQLFRNEEYLAWVLMLSGLLRLGGLIINGARPVATPAIRQASAGLGFIIWVGISYCFYESQIWGLWLASWPLFAITELVNFYRAAHDHGEAYVGRSTQ